MVGKLNDCSTLSFSDPPTRGPLVFCTGRISRSLAVYCLPHVVLQSLASGQCAKLCNRLVSTNQRLRIRRHDQSASETCLLVHTCTWLSHVSLLLRVLSERDVTGTPNPHTLFDVHYVAAMQCKQWKACQRRFKSQNKIE